MARQSHVSQTQFNAHTHTSDRSLCHKARDKHKHQIQQKKSRNRNKHTLKTNMTKRNATGVGRPSFSMHFKQHSRKRQSARFGRLMDHWQIQEQRSDFLLLTQHVLPVILRLPLTRLCAHFPKPQPPAGFGCPGPRMSHQSRAGKNPANMLSSIYLIPWVLSKQAAISWPRWPLHCEDQATFLDCRFQLASLCAMRQPLLSLATSRCIANLGV